MKLYISHVLSLFPTSSRSYSFQSSGNAHYNFYKHYHEQNSNCIFCGYNLVSTEQFGLLTIACILSPVLFFLPANRTNIEAIPYLFDCHSQIPQLDEYHSSTSTSAIETHVVVGRDSCTKRHRMAASPTKKLTTIISDEIQNVDKSVKYF